MTLDGERVLRLTARCRTHSLVLGRDAHMDVVERNRLKRADPTCRAFAALPIRAPQR